MFNRRIKSNPIIFIALIAALAIVCTWLIRELRATYGSYSHPSASYSRTHDGLIAHWKMDESSWATTSAYYVVKDYVGGNHLTPKGSASSSAGHYGNGGIFGGDDFGGDYLCTDSNNDNTCDDDTDLDITDKLTVSVWFKESVLVTADVIVGKYATDKREWVLRKSNASASNLEVTFGDSNGAFLSRWQTSGSGLAEDNWYHAVFIFDSGVAKIFINGIEQTASAVDGIIPSVLNNEDAPLTIGDGGSGQSYPFDGLIDDVKIWNRALSADEVMRQYVEGPGPVGWWSFESASSTGAIDYSGYGNDGVLSGGMDNDNRVPGKVGNAMSFDGVDERVNTGSDMVDVGDDSVCAWIYPKSLGEDNAGRILSNEKFRWHILPTNKIGLRSDGNTVADAIDNSIILNTWQYVCVTRATDGTARNYVNGIDVSDATDSGTPESGTENIFIGADSDGSQAFNGLIDSVRIYNYALTPRQIAMNYNGGEPVGHWTFDEGQGNIAKDSSVNENHGEVVIGTGGDQIATSTAWLNGRKGKIGQALRFDGTDDYVEVGDDASLDITGDITIEAWVKRGALGTQHEIIAKYDVSNAQRAYEITFSTSDDIKFYVSKDGDAGASASSITSTNTYATGIWYHVVGVYDYVADGTSRMRLYVDGGEAATEITNAVGPLHNSSEELMVGARSNGAGVTLPFDGFIDDVRIYNYARTPEEIRKDYNENKGIVLGSAGNKGYERSDGLISHWKFDEASWATTSQDEAVALDSVGGNHGAPHFDASTTAGKFGQAGKFDGDDDYVTGDNILFTELPRTVSGWFKPDSLSSVHRIFSDNDGRSYILIDTDDKIDVAYYTGSEYIIATSNSTFSQNQWYYFAATFESTNVGIYINGILEDSASGDANELRQVSTWAIGINNFNFDGQPFDGLIDDVKIYNKALSADEVMRQYVEGPGPVGWWDFDASQGASAVDKSGYGNTGILSGGMGDNNWVPGKIGNALSFDGGSEYVDCGNDASLNPGLNDFTVEAWVKPNSITGNQAASVIGKWEGVAGKGGFRFGYHGGGDVRLSYLIGDGATFAASAFGSSIIAAREWQHMVGVFDRDDVLTGYINGVSVGTISISTYENDDLQPTTALLIGAMSGGTSRTNGFIDSPKIYNYVLTPSQIAQNYNGGEPIAYWNFDENNASTTRNAADDGRNAADFTGTLTGEGWRTAGKVNSAILFDGDDDVVTVGADSRIDLKDKAEYSVSAWIKSNSATSTDNGVIFQKGSTYFRIQDDASGDIHLVGNIDLATTDALASSTDSLTSGDSSGSSDWRHVIMTYASTSDIRKIKFYIDGIPAKKATDTAGIGNPSDDSGSDLIIGPFDGMIDEVKIYLYELTPEQVRKEYNLNKGIELGTSKNKGYERSDGLISHWKMDESWATSSQDEKTVIDYVGSNHGIAKFDASTTAGKFGNAGKFDGDEDYVSMGDPIDGSLDITDDATMTAWVKFSSYTNFPGILGKVSGGGWDGYGMLIVNSGRLGTWYNGSSKYDDGSVLSTDIWYHVTVVYDKDNVATRYVNGIAYGTTLDISSLTYDGDAQSFVIGNARNLCFDGLIDDVKIWNKALSSDEVMRQYVEGPGPVGWWDFDASQGTSAVDKSGYGNTGTLSGGMGDNNWVPGKIGNALSFDGGSEYVDIGDGGSLKITGSFSAETWLKVNVLDTNKGILAKIASDQNAGYSMRVPVNPANKIVWDISDGATRITAESNDAVVVNTWYYAVGTYDGTTMRLYVNGELQTDTETMTAVSGTDDLQIGQYYTDYNLLMFDGSIDDIKIYNYALTQRQIAMNYNGGLPVGHWKFDEGAGQIAKDSSVHENNGEVVIGTSGDQVATSSAWLNGQAGVLKGALSFDGTDDYVEVGDDASLDMADEITIGMWVYSKDISRAVSSPHYILTKSSDDNGSRAWSFYAHDVSGVDYLSFDPNSHDTDYARCSGCITENRWYYVVGIYDKSEIKLYVNGVLRNSVNYSTSIVTNNSPVIAGARYSESSDAQYFFNGLIDDVRIYNYARTPEEIRNDYNGGMGIHFR